MKDWVFNNKRCPYKEEYYDALLNRPIVQVHFHQLNKVTGKPTGRLPTLTPNTTLIKMNDVVDKIYTDTSQYYKKDKLLPLPHPSASAITLTPCALKYSPEEK